MMTNQLLIILALCIPIATMIFIFTQNKINIRETGILVSTVLLILVTFSLLQSVLDGEQPQLFLLEFLPGLAIHFKVGTIGNDVCLYCFFLMVS